MRELKSPRWITAKGLLFVVLGCLSGGLLLVDRPGLTALLLLVITVWSFCRAYYFAFYVLEHYVDPSYRYSGIMSLVRHVLARRTAASRRD